MALQLKTETPSDLDRTVAPSTTRIFATVADEFSSCFMDAAEQDTTDSRELVIADLQNTLAGPFNLKISAGEGVVITGQSGSGKSLFLRMVADLDQNEGTVKLGARDRRTMTASRWRKLVTYVAAESGWWGDTVVEHFAAEHRSRAALYAAELGLAPDLLNAPVSRMSSGERQRWALIRAVVNRPQVLLLDEPTGALDQSSVDRVETFLKRLLGAERETILIMVTHDAALAERMGGCRLEMVNRKLHAL